MTNLDRDSLLEWRYDRYVLTTADQYLRLIREIESGRFDADYGPVLG